MSVTIQFITQVKLITDYTTMLKMADCSRWNTR